jgi:hypothetical protein
MKWALITRSLNESNKDYIIVIIIPYRTTIPQSPSVLLVFANWRQSDLPEKFIFTNTCDQAKNNELNVMYGWKFELEKQELAKIANTKGRLPLLVSGVVRWTPARHSNDIFKPE